MDDDVICIPNAATAEAYVPAMPEGELMVKYEPKLFAQRYICIRGDSPSGGVAKLALLVPLPSKASA